MRRPLDLAYVAAGRYDGFFEFGLKPWDIAAGALLIMEAGGVMRQIDGATLQLSSGNVFACAASLEPELGGETPAFLREIGWKASPGGGRSSRGNDREKKRGWAGR